MIFRVWAPNASRVEIATGDRLIPMSAELNGWWRGEESGIQPGSDYSFVLDGGEPLPDPRSPWQPAGVDGPSRVVDHSAFPWSDGLWQAKPLGAAFIYELHVGTFSPQGTFEGAIGKLDHLVDLGVTHVELMPVNQFSGACGWGYDGVDLYAPQNSYGGPLGLKRLVNACHAKGLAVIIDVVYNHLGPAGNYLNRFGPYLTDRYSTPWGQAVNLDGALSDEVRRFFIDNALMWFRDYHADGLRLDAIHALIDNGATHFLEQLSLETAELSAEIGRHLVLIAESELNDPQVIRSRELGGYGIDAQWSDDLHHALHTVLTGENTSYYRDFGGLADLAKALKDAYVYDGRHSVHRQRRHGRPAFGLPGSKFLSYIQNHDQIGNRPLGERISHLVSLGKAKVAGALALLAPFVPMIFQGEEWAASTPFQYFTRHENPELAKAVSEGRRNEFGGFGWDKQEVPDPQDPATFERCRLRWEEVEDPRHAEMLDWYRSLMRLRRSTTWLSDGNRDKVCTRFDASAQWLVLERGPVSIACNLAPQSQCVQLTGGDVQRILLRSDESNEVTECGVRLAPESVIVVEAVSKGVA